MISIEELSERAKQRNLPLYYQEKEYLQFIFLNSISKYPDKLVFKGGTCLKICFGLERASEDLDFSLNINLKEARDIIYSCLKDFQYLNIPYESYSEKEFEGNFRIEVRFKGPLYNGNLNSTNTLKIDLNKQKTKNTQVKVIQKLFSDVPLFTIKILAEKEILAEKIRALINRSEPKDLYDLWFLFNKGIEIDKILIKEKLKEEKSKISNLIYPSKKEYDLALRQLVNILPSYEQVIKEVSKYINEITNKK